MTVSFTSTKLPHGWMGNMAPYPVHHLGQRWNTAEHLFQALRFAEDAPIRRTIRLEGSPMSAKLVAKGLQQLMVVVPCSDQDLENMRQVVRLKVDQHPYLRTLLLDTGSELIIEDVTKRQRGNAKFWGAARTGPTTWSGDNNLGLILMELRESLRG